MRSHLASGQTLAVPENRSAFSALHDVADALIMGADLEANLLVLHGAAGSGKTYLFDVLVAALQKDGAEKSLCRVNAADLVVADSTIELLERARTSQLLIVEDLQYLAPSFVETLIQLLDLRWAERRLTFVSAITGPSDLSYRGARMSARLRSRLAAGLVVVLRPLTFATRLAVLESRIRHLMLEQETLVWLAESFRTWRQLEGLVCQLQVLAREQQLTHALILQHFEAATSELTVERITEHVGDHFQLSSKRLRSRDRARHVLVPRQIGMYLARRLTDHSLDDIGRYYGRRDHSTVLHACTKIERDTQCSAALAGTVRRLEAELS